MGLKDLVNKGKCLIGLHEGAWTAASPTDCTFTRKCVRCAAVHTKVEHAWGDWRFLREGDCDEGRSCGRCSLHDERVTHSFGAATYLSDTSCERREECQRCHTHRVATTQHTMTNWRFVAADECRQLQQCSRCHADGTVTRTEHAWGDWQHSNALSGPVRVCRRCGELQSRPGAPVEHTRTPPPVITEDAVADLLARATTAHGSASPATTRDPALVAHWRHTSAMSSGAFSMATDTHLVLQADGQLRRWTHSAGSMGSQTSDPFTGSWHCDGDVVRFQYDDGDVGELRYTVQGSTLYFPDGGSQKIWERVR